MAKTEVIISAKDETKAAFNSVQSGLSKLNQSLAAIGIGFSLGTVISAFTEIMDKATEAERIQNKMNAVLRATGNAAGLSSGELNEMADSLALVSKFDDEQLKDAMSTLLTFPNIARDNFERAMQAATDMAVLFDGDLKSSIQAVGKALSDPAEGLSALNRSGIRFNATQEEMIKKFAETGRTAQAQEIILKELETRMGGTAQAENAGMAGAARSVTKEWDNLLESLGRTSSVQAGVSAGLGTIAKALQGINKEIDASRQRSISELFKNMSRADRIKLGIEVEPTLNKEGVNKLRQSLSGLNLPQVKILSDDEVAREDAALKKQQESLKKLLDGLQSETSRAQTDILSDELSKSQARIKLAESEWRAKADAAKLGTEQMKKFNASLQQYLVAQEMEDMKKLQEKQQREYQQRADRATALHASLDSEFAAEEEQRQRLRELEVLYRSGAIQDRLAYNAMEIQIHEEFADRIKQINEKRNQEDIDRGFGEHKFNAELNKRMMLLWQQGAAGRLEVTRVLSGQLSGLMYSSSKKMFEIGKKAALAEATISMFQSVQNALATKPFLPLGLAMGAIAVANGLANISAIRRQQFEGGGSAAPTFSANPSTGMPLSAPSSSPVADEGSAAKDSSVTIIIQGHVVGTREFVDSYLIPEIKDAVNNRDETLFSNNSRQARELLTA